MSIKIVNIEEEILVKYTDDFHRNMETVATYNKAEDGLRDLHEERFGKEIYGLSGEEEMLASKEINGK